MGSSATTRPLSTRTAKGSNLPGGSTQTACDRNKIVGAAEAIREASRRSSSSLDRPARQAMHEISLHNRKKIAAGNAKMTDAAIISSQAMEYCV